jgi:hypothetical protein
MEYVKWMKENLIASQGRKHALQEEAKSVNLHSLENQPENGQIYTLTSFFQEGN